MTPPDKDKSQIIRQCYLFTDAAETSIKRLAERSTFESLPKRRDLFAAGDEPDGLRIVLSGLVRVWVNDAEGRELTLTLIEPGEALGEIALLDGMERSTNASVIEPTTALLLRQSAFDDILDTDPKLARQLIVLLCDRLRRNTDDLRGFAFHDMRLRLARKLYELSAAHAEFDGNTARFMRKFSQTDLALMLGATREAINKRLAALSFDGILQTSGGEIRILDVQRLSDIAQDGEQD